MNPESSSGLENVCQWRCDFDHCSWLTPCEANLEKPGHATIAMRNAQVAKFSNFGFQKFALRN